MLQGQSGGESVSNKRMLGRACRGTLTVVGSGGVSMMMFGGRALVRDDHGGVVGGERMRARCAGVRGLFDVLMVIRWASGDRVFGTTERCRLKSAVMTRVYGKEIGRTTGIRV